LPRPGRVDPQIEAEAGQGATGVVALTAVAVEVAQGSALVLGGDIDSRWPRPPARRQTADETSVDEHAEVDHPGSGLLAMHGLRVPVGGELERAEAEDRRRSPLVAALAILLGGKAVASTGRAGIGVDGARWRHEQGVAAAIGQAVR